MTDMEIFEALKPLLAEALGITANRVRMESTLMAELGAESIDLLDLSFRIEERFKITIGPREIEQDARKRLGNGDFEKEGFLTPEAITELKRILPEIDQNRLGPGLRKSDLPSLLTVGFFVRLIGQKLAVSTTGGQHA